jgi:sarcosine oxidase, subunit beta
VELPERARVVVIGGGVIGTSIAFHLAEAGVSDVVLLERDQLGSGSTCRAAGGVRGSFSTAANVALGLRGIDRYSRFDQDHGQEIEFRRNGYLYLLSDDVNVAAFTESVALQNSFGMPSRMIDPDQAQQVSPLISTEGLLAAAWSPGDARVTPDGVVAGYASSARRLGARLITGCAVTGIESGGGTIAAVVTEQGIIRTSAVVCAAGAWSGAVGRMVGVELPVTPLRRQLAFTAPNEAVDPAAPLTVDFPANVYFHPEGRGLLLGWSDPDELAGFNLQFELEPWLAGFADVAARRIPKVLDFGIVGGWAGLYEVTPDHNQLIGRAAAVADFYYATGYSGHGFLMGPATGEIIRDLYLDRLPAFDISPFDVRRFDVTTVEPEPERNIV